MEDRILEELYASYHGDAYATNLRNMVEKYGDLKVAEMIVDQYEDSQKHSNTEVIGFQIISHTFWANVKHEFDKLVCGQEPYEKENQDYLTMGKFFSLATASSIAMAISTVVSIPVYILTPTVALMLHSVFKVGRNAYCETVNRKK